MSTNPLALIVSQLDDETSICQTAKFTNIFSGINLKAQHFEENPNQNPNLTE